MAFSTELELVKTVKSSQYLDKLTKPGPCIIKEEVKGFFGIPDLIVVDHSSNDPISYAFEMKLSNWKRAHYQAFRYKSFVNKSYVIMDNDHISPVLKKIDRFLKSNIGLMSIDNSGRVYVHHNPYDEMPFSPQLALKFRNMLLEGK